jgi:DNA-binding response OmpR family regulator
MIKAMLVEDDRDIKELISYQLGLLNISVESFSNGEAALKAIKSQQYDLFLLDWMLPGLSGIDLTMAIRQEIKNKDKPIIMVTALSQAENIVHALDLGVDDYITKPFDLNIFKAKIRSHLRRLKLEANPSEEIEVEALKINFSKCTVEIENNPIHLTHSEFKILSLLIKKPGHVFTREQLINSIQGDSVHVTNRTIDTHVAGLRKKMATKQHLIETIRGIGYRFYEIE